MFQYVINLAETYRQTLSNILSYKNLLKSASGMQHIVSVPTLPVLSPAPAIVPEGMFDRISQLVARIKKSFGYSDNIGEDLGIIPPSSASVDVDTMQPDLQIKLNVGRPRLKWIKGYSDAADVYVDRNDGNGFIFLVRSLKSEFIDTAVLAPSKVFDEWKYKAIYIIGNTPVGLYSNIVTVDVKKL